MASFQLLRTEVLNILHTHQTIYIMGRGYSGSTILSSLLGHLESVTCVGELIYPMNIACGCGAAFDECPFWLQVKDEFERATGLIWETSLEKMRAQAHYNAFPRTLTAPADSPYLRELDDINRAILGAICAVAGVERVLDSSKQPSRALLLTRTDSDARFLHIIRSPERYLFAYMKRLAKGRVAFLRRRIRSGPFNFLLLIVVAFSWLISNLQAEIVRLRRPDAVLRVRYEDLIADPAAELRRIGRFLDLDVRPLLEAIDAGKRMDVGHIIAGNAHMRVAGSFVFEPQIGAHVPLPMAHNVMVKLVTWPLKLVYGYSLVSEPTQSTSAPVEAVARR